VTAIEREQRRQSGKTARAGQRIVTLPRGVVALRLGGLNSTQTLTVLTSLNCSVAEDRFCPKVRGHGSRDVAIVGHDERDAYAVAPAILERRRIRLELKAMLRALLS
jgi:hypothetical protein